MKEIDLLPPRQKEVLHLIVKLTEDQGYPPTLAELALALGLKNRMTVHQHVAALKRKGMVQWEPGLNRSLRVVSGKDKVLSMPKKASTGKRPLTSPIKGLPLAGTIAAGVPIDAQQTDDYLKIESNYAESGCYALKIKGDSMIEDGIYDGDFVIVKPNQSPRNGEIVVALLEDGSATLKHFYREKGHYRLQPANKNMEPIFIDKRQELNIQGTVVGLFRQM